MDYSPRLSAFVPTSCVDGELSRQLEALAGGKIELSRALLRPICGRSADDQAMPTRAMAAVRLLFVADIQGT
jgi:hypothetical protein